MLNQTIKFKKCYPSKEQNLDQTYNSLQQGEWVDFEVILQGWTVELEVFQYFPQHMCLANMHKLIN